ncbi:histidine kinase dimerization/phosphoacceptor domain -containing protein [soil metagenome]
MAPVPPTDHVGAALALAVIASSQAPLLLLDEDLQIVAASESFSVTFGLDPQRLRGRSLFALGAGEWDMPRLRSLLSAVGSGGADVPAYELDMVGPEARRRVLIVNARRLDFSEGAPVRLLLTLADATDARAAEKLRDDLLRDKDILLRELQHRVANSLQIIASVLLQNARKVQSEESRVHLRDAHQRVMSVAAVQKQLAVAGIGEVALKPYFQQLCKSLAASMIPDHDQLWIEVSGDGSATTSEISVSLGLVVTELVINALKHAFPDNRRGVVTVDYHSENHGWALSVCDDGVGMPTSLDRPAAGLGTAIVQALAAQLSATIKVTDLAPGTGVSLVHRRPLGLAEAAESPPSLAV